MSSGDTRGEEPHQAPAAHTLNIAQTSDLLQACTPGRRHTMLSPDFFRGSTEFFRGSAGRIL